MFDLKEMMDKLVTQELEAGGINGANVLVLHRNKEIYFNTFGYADKEKGIPMRRDTIFRMFSMTKPVTAAAVMILAQRGEIDLKDPVSRYMPYFAGQQVWTPSGRIVPAERDSTVWDMLNMLSGIPYPDINSEPGRRMDSLFRKLIGRRERGEKVDTQEYLKNIARVPLMFQPGTKWMYGLSADVLGGLIEAVSGRKFGEFLEEEILRRLG